MSEQPKTFLVSVLKPYRRQFAVFFLLSGIGITAFTATPFIIRNLIDYLVAGRIEMRHVWWLVAGFGLLRFIDEWFWRLGENYVRGFFPQLRESLRLRMFESTLRKRHVFFVNASSGKIGFWIENVSNAVEQLISVTIWTVWNRSYGFLVAIVFLAFANWLLAVLFGLWLVGLFAVIVYRGRRQGRLSRHYSDSVGDAGSLVVDAVANNLPVRVFTARRREAARLQEQQTEIIRRWRRAWGYEVVSNMLKGNSAALVSTLCLAVIVVLFHDKRVSIGDIALLVTYVTSISETIWDLSFQLNSYFRNYGSLRNGLDGLLTADDERRDGRKLRTERLSVSFKDVRFAYPDQPETDVLAGISLDIPAGKKYGVVGHSGAGKSTLSGLLLGLYEPTAGSIEYDGQPMASLSLESVRRHIAYVPQDAGLFNRSIRDNIAFGAGKTVSDEAVRLAAQRAEALSFIEELPDGFDSLVGERGVKLSGGQKQRIAIARAMLSAAPLVLLDEATSALDSVSEQAIQRALAEIMERRTALVIAHRLSTLKHLDRIIVLDKGRIAEAGTHDELLAAAGIYADLWQRQRDGFLGN